MVKKLSLLTFFLSFIISSVQSKDLLPVGVTVITRDDFKGNHFVTVGEVLDNQVSVNIEKIGYKGTVATAKIRGVSDSNQVQVLLNGRPLSHEFNGRVDLSQLPLTLVDEIHISRGGGPLSMTGESVGGTINIITTHPIKEGLDSEIGTGVGKDGVTYSDGRFRGRSYWGDLSLLAGLRRSSGYMFNEEMETNHTLGNITRSFKGKGYWGLEYFSQESEIGLSNGTSAPFDQWNRKEERNANTPNRLKEEEFQYAKGSLASPEIGGGFFYADYTHSIRNENELSAPNQFILFDKDHVSKHVHVKYKRKLFEIGSQQQANRRTLFPFNINKTQQSAIYITDTWKSEKWLISPSLRYNHHSVFKGILTPRIVGVLEPFKKYILSGSITKGYRTPNFDELYIGIDSAIPNRNLDPEISWTYDAGARLPVGQNGSLSFSGFFIRSEDVIQASPVTSQFINNGKQRIDGYETEITVRSGMETSWRHFEFSGNYTHQKSQRNSKNGLGFVQTALSPSELANLKIVQNFPRRVSLTNELRYQSKQFQFDNKGGLKLPSYYVWNIRFKVKILTSELYFDVDNVTQRRYADTLAIYTPTTGSARLSSLAPQPDRSYFAGMIIRFDN